MHGGAFLAHFPGVPWAGSLQLEVLGRRILDIGESGTVPARLDKERRALSEEEEKGASMGSEARICTPYVAETRLNGRTMRKRGPHVPSLA